MSERIITPWQLKKGFRIFAAGSVWRGEWIVIRKLDDGNYLAEDPKPEYTLQSSEHEREER